jgi:DNA excision repair protein ERCC-3
MPPMFRQSYQDLNRAELIHTANPEKFKILQYLIKKHTHFGDKILVFCDRPKILEKYAKLLKRPFIHG